VPAEQVEQRILTIRGQRVILDRDLSAIYGVTTGRLNEQVRRNRDRFPGDFAYVLTAEEVAILKSQNAISRSGHGGRRSRPYVFTEFGAIMAANVLNSPVAISASILVVRAFVRMREMLGAHAELARKIDEMEKKYDSQFKVVFDALRQLMAPPQFPRRPIGFHVNVDRSEG
jgi:hypothetical protein